MAGMKVPYRALVAARLRSRKVQFAALLAIIAVASGTALCALSLRTAADRPWDRVFVATHGGDVQVLGRDPDAVRATADRPEVAEASPLVAQQFVALDVGGQLLRLDLRRAPERDDQSVDRPAVVDGSWLSDSGGGIVLEATFADTLGIKPGDEVGLAPIDGDDGGFMVALPRAATLQVTGTAATTVKPTYPESTPGIAWIDAPTFDAAELDAVVAPLWTIGLRLHDPALGTQVSEDIMASGSSGDGTGGDPLDARPAADIRATSRPELAASMRRALLIFSTLLLVGAVLLVFTLLGSRVVSDARQLALLQVAGVTPGQLAVLVAFEHAVVAGAGTAAGVGAAHLVGPRLTEVASSRLGSVPPSISGGQVALVAAVAIGTAVMASAVAGHRAGRASLAVVARGGQAHGPSRLTALAAQTASPVAVILGLKDALGRRGQALVLMATLALAVMSAVAALGAEAGIHQTDEVEVDAEAGVAGETTGPPGRPVDEVHDVPVDIEARRNAGIPGLLAGLESMLALVALANVLAAGFMSTRERLRELGVLHAVGCTPRQLVATTGLSHALLAVPAALAGIPLGIALLETADPGRPTHPSTTAVVTVLLATVALAAVVAALPAAALRHRWLSPNEALAPE